MPRRLRNLWRRLLDGPSAYQSVQSSSHQSVQSSAHQIVQHKPTRRPDTPPCYYVAPRTDLPPYRHLGIADPVACMAAIATAIYTAAVASPAAAVSAVTDAVAAVIRDTAFFVAHQSPDVAPAAAAAIAAAIANIANTSAGTPPGASTPTVEDITASAFSTVHVMDHLPDCTYESTKALAAAVCPTFHPVWKVMRTVSATSAPAVACALDSAVTSVTSAVAATTGPDGCMLNTASTYADNACRVARVLTDGVAALMVQEHPTLVAKSA